VSPLDLILSVAGISLIVPVVWLTGGLGSATIDGSAAVRRHLALADAWATRLERLLIQDTETKGGRSSAAVWFGHNLGGDPRRVARARRAHEDA